MVTFLFQSSHKQACKSGVGGQSIFHKCPKVLCCFLETFPQYSKQSADMDSVIETYMLLSHILW